MTGRAETRLRRDEKRVRSDFAALPSFPPYLRIISAPDSCMKRIAGWLVLLALCASCAGLPIRARNTAYSPTTDQRIGQVVRQPLADFNLSETEIPALLAKISAAPYAPPARMDCPSLRAETAAITRFLGPDIDTNSLDGKGRRILNDGSAAAWGMARGAADGWIPFHGVIRGFSGAARHERLVERAILSGFVRRAYLRGLMEARCP